MRPHFVCLIICAILSISSAAPAERKPAAATQQTPATPSEQTPATPSEQKPAPPANQSGPESGYRIDEPGTITFTVGVKIKGKVEKPQVVIFLPKEKPYYREISFAHSFSEELVKPLPFSQVDVP
jgi:hypothetical protein